MPERPLHDYKAHVSKAFGSLDTTIKLWDANGYEGR